MAKRFTRVNENFVCQNCGQKVKGSGYTNHCPKCLWSKHVDINPGDRQVTCQGLMKPVAIENKKGSYVIVHQCTICKQRKRNKAAGNDSFEEILRIAGQVRG